MKRLIKNLESQLKKIIEQYPNEINKDSYWRGVKIGLETALNVAKNPVKKHKKGALKDYQIVVFKGYDNNLFYTAQVRSVYFLFKTKWRDITPTMQPTYDDALKLFCTKPNSLLDGVSCSRS